MVRIILSLLLSIPVSLVLAQAESHACGQVTTPGQIAFLKANNPNLSLAFRPSMDTLHVPVLFHRIADENGNGAVSEADCADALVALNALYAEGRIVFEECESPRLISDSVFYDYQYSEEFALRQAHEVSGVINVFIPNRASSSSGGQVCGYAYLPPTRRDITIVKASCFTNGTTFPHEVGHFLGLYHTHGTSNCGSLTDELVDGSNCVTQGDDVCDTPADPNLLGIECDRYVVNSSCVYTGTEVDANGDTFTPDTRNIMSYSRKACRQHFSAGQLDRVRFYLGTSRAYLTCPSSVCASTDPDPIITDWSMTTMTVALEDNGQQSAEVEYRVNGGPTISLTTTQALITLDGFSACDNIEVRARNVCPSEEGAWSSYDDVILDGCNLQYCPQPNNNLALDFSELSIDNQLLPDLITLDNYGIHSGELTINLDVSAPRVELSLEAFALGRSAPDSMYMQVWLDVNTNDAFSASERMLQQKVSTSEVFETAFPIAAGVPRNLPLRMRITASVESFIDPCATEFGETEDVNVVFQGGLPLLSWSNATLSVDAPAQSVAVPISGNVSWTVTGLPSWLSASETTGSASDSSITFSVARNIACAPRTATLVISNGNGLTDELVVTQNPASPGVSVSLVDTVYVGPLAGAVQFSTESLHTYAAASADPWLPFMEDDLLDVVNHQLDYPINPDLTDRIGHVNVEGCGAATGFVLKQAVGRTAWVDPADIQLQAVGDTITLNVASNVDWDALTPAPWLSALGIAGTGNGQVMYLYAGGASAGETAEITLNGTYGLTEGPAVVTVIAPLVSSASTPRLSAKLVMANPITDRLVASTASAKTYHWSVQSSLGQQLHASFGESINLDTAHWPTGTYFVKLEDEAGRLLVQRVVKF